MIIELHEEDKAIEILKTGEIDKKPSKTISLLARYYKKLKKDEKQTMDDIDLFMKKYYTKEYNTVLWNDIIEKIINNEFKKDRNLINVNNVHITAIEMEYIGKIKNIKYEKLAFTYLVYAKILNQINENNNNWVSGKHRNEIFKDANVKDTGKTQLKVLHNMIIQDIFCRSVKVNNNSLNVSNYINEESEIVLTIDDFREIGLQYLRYIGEKILKCECCDKLVKPKSKKATSIKYCKECAKDKQKEWDRNYKKRIRK